MAAAARVVVGHPLIRPGRGLVAIAVKVPLSLRRDGNAVEPFRRMRGSPGPNNQDQHHRANEGCPTEHQSCP